MSNIRPSKCNKNYNIFLLLKILKIIKYLVIIIIFKYHKQDKIKLYPIKILSL